MKTGLEKLLLLVPYGGIDEAARRRGWPRAKPTPSLAQSSPSMAG